MGSMLNICIIVGISVVIGLATATFPYNGDPTICCASTATPACDDTGYSHFYDAIRPLFNTSSSTEFAQFLVTAGCWCQNYGYGPPSPTWLTCPEPLGTFIIIAYRAQAAAGITDCHCNCPTQTGPALPCPPAP